MYPGFVGLGIAEGNTPTGAITSDTAIPPFESNLYVITFFFNEITISKGILGVVPITVPLVGVVAGATGSVFTTVRVPLAPVALSNTVGIPLNI